MLKRNKSVKRSPSNFLISFCLSIAFFSVNTLADTSNLFLEGGKFNVDSGGTIERFVIGMSNHPGRMRFKAGFHVDSGIGEFVQIRIEIKKGAQLVYSGSCFSIHSPSEKTPKCDLTINIPSAFTNTPDNYILRVNNNSGKRIKDFAIQKSGFDPLMPDFKSTWTPDCPSSVKLDMGGSPFSLERGETKSRDLIGFGANEGRIEIHAKWHTATIIPNVFVKLKVDLLRPNGTVAKSVDNFSHHAPLDKTPNFRATRIFYQVTKTDAEMSGRWRIRVKNDSNDKIEGFDIEKGSDGNPYLTAFISTYKRDCK